MNPQIAEKKFEEAIEAALTRQPERREAGGLAEGLTGYGSAVCYSSRAPGGYERKLCLMPVELLSFVQGSQPKEWEKLKQHYGEQTRDRFVARVASEIATRGTLDVLRKGVKDSGCRFHLAYFPPATTLNEDAQRLYHGNLFAVVRQLRFSEKSEDSLDLALFLNGLPIFTAELKNPLNGQDVKDAIKQYEDDRDPREPLFAFGRCLAHFAVDPDLVYVTTKLEGQKTRFLPFNKGKFGGAGNPPAQLGYSTAYLWEEVWAPESVLNLIAYFIHTFDEEDENGKKTGRKLMIFPRYHQLDAVRRMVSDARLQGAGHRYLVQHSAGSGKSNSIAWLAHQLSVLHDPNNERVFDSIIVITDRRVLDRQLQQTIRQFEQTTGVVENISHGSKQLKDALEQGKTIIVSTLQKFPHIAGDHRGAARQAVRHHRRRSALQSEWRSVGQEPQSRLRAEGPWRGREGAGGGRHRGRRPRRLLREADEPAPVRAPQERLRLRLHRHAQAEDARALRHEAPGRQVRAVQPLQHAPGHRGEASSSTCWRTTPPTTTTGAC